MMIGGGSSEENEMEYPGSGLPAGEDHHMLEEEENQ
jgi:hypothetical protein